jgi:hypothetical protein
MLDSFGNPFEQRTAAFEMVDHAGSPQQAGLAPLELLWVEMTASPCNLWQGLVGWMVCTHQVRAIDAVHNLPGQQRDALTDQGRGDCQGLICGDLTL